jgi:hypothetical protein
LMAELLLDSSSNQRMIFTINGSKVFPHLDVINDLICCIDDL